GSEHEHGGADHEAIPAAAQRAIVVGGARSRFPSGRPIRGVSGGTSPEQRAGVLLPGTSCPAQADQLPRRTLSRFAVPLLLTPLRGEAMRMNRDTVWRRLLAVALAGAALGSATLPVVWNALDALHQPGAARIRYLWFWLGLWWATCHVKSMAGRFFGYAGV